MSILNFNAANVKPQAAMEPLPSGWYTSKIVESETKPTSKNNGSTNTDTMLALTFEVLAPAEFAGRKFYTNLNINNSNPTAQEIAYAQLSAICHATNVIQVADSNQLHNIPLDVQLK